ncbi:MAG: SUMF1/EgtB/PvdO family nonheme iron enzyme, partial [Gammaproteobacteria bacterium]|nr:SUMF1/EgtB/PvdO family nonheme iron enzyme [Gammaproteobacteria bacterium]
QQLKELERRAVDRLVQLNNVQDKVAGSKAVEEELKREMIALRQQKDDLQQELEQRDEQESVMRLEHEQLLVKAHEDLTHKNDIEQELQNQVDRLRKKLEQTTLKHQDVLEAAQVDIDSIREVLHTERSARSAERAEMAARQRELKEKLAAVATEYEENIANHAGAIEQAKISGSEEEQALMQQMREIQLETENQLETLRSELSQAHDEIAALVKHEKIQRHEEHDLADARKQEFESSLDQLRTQTQQLVQERDAALKDQGALREEMSSLRAEVEVARGLMGGGRGHVEDPSKLRRELSEARKNVEIAVRLRGETEEACARLKAERDALQKQVGNKLNLGEPLSVPSLDRDAKQADRSVFTETPASASPVPPVSGKKLAVFTGSSRRLARSIGLGVIVIAGLVSGLKLLVESPVPLVMQVQDEGETLASTGPAAEGQEAVPVIESTRPITPAPQVAQPEPRVIRQQRLAATGSFRDSMQGGGFTPLMVELPAATFLMGSQGTSLNFDEGPRHEVSLPRFAISKHEVTFSDYDRFARATGARLPHDETWGRGDRPVINVSWKDAQAYVRWLSAKTGHAYSLPAEAQWEFAARAGTSTQYPWDAGSDDVRANCFDCGSKWDHSRTAPVGSFSANYFGLHDMGGNVMEWTEDCYR